MKRYTLYKIWTYILTIITISLIVWGCYQKSSPTSGDDETRYVLVLGIIGAFTASRWLRISFDDSIKY
jgi:hypothetical protein